MKIDWNKYSLTAEPTAISSDYYPTTVTTNISINSDIQSAIASAVNRRMEMEEKKTKGVSFDALEKTLRKMGIFLTEIHQDSYNDYAEIICRVNPIDWYISLDKKDTPATKDSRPHPKKVIFCGPATTILWTDGTKTTVRCYSEDVWEDEVGIAMCYLKKMLGNKGNYNNIFREAMKVAVVQELKEKLASTIDSSMHTSSALDDMANDTDKMNKYMKVAIDALSEAVTKDVEDALSEFVKEKK
jgi:hypothetical protein